MEWLVPQSIIEGSIPVAVKGTYLRVGPVKRTDGIVGKEEHELERDAALLSITFSNSSDTSSGVLIRYKEIAPPRRGGKKICTQSNRKYGLLSDLSTYIQYRNGDTKGWFHSTNYGAHLQSDLLLLTSPFGRPVVVDPYSLTPLGIHANHKSCGRVRVEHYSKKNIGFSLRKSKNSFQLIITENSKPTITAWVPPTLVPHDFIVTDHFFIFYLCGGWQASEVWSDPNVMIGLTPPINHLDMDAGSNQFYDSSKNCLMLVSRSCEQGKEPNIITIPIRGFVVSFGGIVRDLQSEILISAVVSKNFRFTDDSYADDESGLHILRIDLSSKQCLQTSLLSGINHVVMHSFRETMPCRYAYCWSDSKLVKYDYTTGVQSTWNPPQNHQVSGITFIPPTDNSFSHQEDDSHIIVQINPTVVGDGSQFIVIYASTLTVKAVIPVPIHLPASHGSTFSSSRYVVSRL